MGHLGSTYEKYYTPTHIARDFQSIYFGSPSEDLLIESVARMGLSRDQHAPTELNDDQLEEIRNNLALVALRKKRVEYKNQLHSQGFYPISKAEGTDLHKQYENCKRMISKTYQKLHRERLDKAIHEFHDSVDTNEIARQLNGTPATEVLTLPTVEFEIRERATIAGMLFQPFKNDKARIKFIYALARLCHRQETRQPKASKQKKTDFVIFKGSNTSFATKRKKFTDGFENVLKDPTPNHTASDKIPQGAEAAKQESGISEVDQVETIQYPHLYPMVLPHPVCLICIGNDEFSHERRMRSIPRKDVLKKHVESHFEQPEYQREFECRHPKCSMRLEGIMHFKRHACDVHGVFH